MNKIHVLLTIQHDDSSVDYVTSEFLSVILSPFKDVKFELSTNDDALIGDDIQIVVRVRNYSNSQRTLSGRITLTSIYYTGTRHKAIGYMEVDDKVVESGKSKLTLCVRKTNKKWVPAMSDTVRSQKMDRGWKFWI